MSAPTHSPGVPGDTTPDARSDRLAAALHQEFRHKPDDAHVAWEDAGRITHEVWHSRANRVRALLASPEALEPGDCTACDGTGEGDTVSGYYEREPDPCGVCGGTAKQPTNEQVAEYRAAWQELPTYKQMLEEVLDAGPDAEALEPDHGVQAANERVRVTLEQAQAEIDVMRAQEACVEGRSKRRFGIMVHDDPEALEYQRLEDERRRLEGARLAKLRALTGSGSPTPGARPSAADLQDMDDRMTRSVEASGAFADEVDPDAARAACNSLVAELMDDALAWAVPDMGERSEMLAPFDPFTPGASSTEPNAEGVRETADVPGKVSALALACEIRRHANDIGVQSLAARQDGVNLLRATALRAASVLHALATSATGDTEAPQPAPSVSDDGEVAG